MTGQEPVIIRGSLDVPELQACVALQKEVWQFGDADLIPLRMFVVAQKIGGQVLGAFSGKELVGFAMAIPGTRCGHSYLHSHMLAVRQQFRNSGIGRKLKLAQREDAVARKIDLIEWTFDPLEIKNAYLNITKLGAIARRYNVNQYGVSSSPLQGGLPTDRLVAEWWVRSRRVTSILNGAALGAETTTTVEVPGKIYEWKATEAAREKARQVQSRNRELFLKAFAEGLAVLDYQRSSNGDGRFLLGRWDESWSYALAK